MGFSGSANHDVECAVLYSLFKVQLELVGSVTGLPRDKLFHVVLVMAQKAWELRPKGAAAEDYSAVDPDQLVQRCLNVLLDGGLSDSAVAFWLAKSGERVQVVKKECSLCFDTFNIDSMFTMDCVTAHRFCFDCIRDSITFDVGRKVGVRCPARECEHEVTEMEMTQLFPRSSPIMVEWEEMMRDIGVQRLASVVRCPRKGCQNAMVLADPKGLQRERCDCTACGSVFCSMCRLAYHYRMTCQQAREFAQEWMLWTGRDRQHYHAIQGRLQTQHDEFAQAQRRLQLRHEEQYARNREEAADEAWKQQWGKLCPSCNRVIVKEGGCDSMICGSDAHGGNQQNGCGQRFQWSAARPYQSSIRPLQLDELNLKPPKQKTCDIVHDYTCDDCKRPIIGIRFECLHCPCFNVCENCEFRTEHPDDHVFCLCRTEKN